MESVGIARSASSMTPLRAGLFTTPESKASCLITSSTKRCVRVSTVLATYSGLNTAAPRVVVASMKMGPLYGVPRVSPGALPSVVNRMSAPGVAVLNITSGGISEL